MPWRPMFCVYGTARVAESLVGPLRWRGELRSPQRKALAATSIFNVSAYFTLRFLTFVRSRAMPTLLMTSRVCSPFSPQGTAQLCENSSRGSDSFAGRRGVAALGFMHGRRQCDRIQATLGGAMQALVRRRQHARLSRPSTLRRASSSWNWTRSARQSLSAQDTCKLAGQHLPPTAQPLVVPLPAAPLKFREPPQSLLASCRGRTASPGSCEAPKKSPIPVMPPQPSGRRAPRRIPGFSGVNCFKVRRGIEWPQLPGWAPEPWGQQRGIAPTASGAQPPR